MKVKERKGWSSLNKDFQLWYQDKGSPAWKHQKRWLSKKLVKGNYIQEEQLSEMWITFNILTAECSSWKVQSKILSLITLCLDKNIGDFLDDHIK